MRMSPGHNKERSNWALFSLCLVLILFGLFWLWQKHELEKAPEPIPVVHALPSPQTSDDLFSNLEASAVNIPIPPFETVF